MFDREESENIEYWALIQVIKRFWLVIRIARSDCGILEMRPEKWNIGLADKENLQPLPTMALSDHLARYVVASQGSGSNHFLTLCRYRCQFFGISIFRPSDKTNLLRNLRRMTPKHHLISFQKRKLA